MYAELWSFLGKNVEHSLLEKMGEQDRRALHAFVELCRLYQAADTAGKSAAIVGMAAAAGAMGADVRRVCRWGVAHVLDWADVDPIWKQVTEGVEGLRARPDPLLQKMLETLGPKRTAELFPREKPKARRR